METYIKHSGVPSPLYDIRKLGLPSSPKMCKHSVNTFKLILNVISLLELDTRYVANILLGM